jgi:release factor glutamine methyltransferase
VTILEVIQRSTDFLAKRGIESPRLQVELLLAHVLKLPRMKLYLSFDRALLEAELTTLRTLIQRRARREPLQHITGSTSFCGLEISVNSSVLVPRPETESLAEQAWKYLQTVNPPPVMALDFGTGSGCLAIALTLKCPGCRVHAVDISTDALAVARTNAAAHRVEGQIEFHTGDGFAALPPDVRFDCIVSNPPYIPTTEIPQLEPEVRDFDPRLALDGGADGLDFYRRLAAEADAWLKPQGRLMAEFGDGQATAIVPLFSTNGWQIDSVEKDLDGRERCFVASRNPRNSSGKTR